MVFLKFLAKRKPYSICDLNERLFMSFLLFFPAPFVGGRKGGRCGRDRARGERILIGSAVCVCVCVRQTQTDLHTHTLTLELYGTIGLAEGESERAQ